MSVAKPVALIILDGFALREEKEGNAVALAHKPNFDRYWNEYPHTILTASGEAVGLPDGQMGNSEVGHLNIGAGRIVYQDLTRISKSIRDGDFFKNETLVGAIRHALTQGKKLHLLGLLSDGGVHSHIEHLLALLELAKREGLNDRVYVHAFLDGRDVSPDSSPRYMEQLLQKMRELGLGQVATVHGRYYAMDRDKRWDRVEKSYRAIVYGDGPAFTDPMEVIRASHAQSVYDEFVVPAVIQQKDGRYHGHIDDGDAVIFFNFRPDRAIQLSQALTRDDFDGFDRGERVPKNLHFVCMTTYSETINGSVAFAPLELVNTLGEVLAKNGLKQLRTAETEKYPHVTFFFSGGRDVELPGETRILIHSPKVATYDLKPEMSAVEVTEAILPEITGETADFICLNFANADMVGHTGVWNAAIQAAETVDQCVSRIVPAALAHGYSVFLTADHGNSDYLINADGSPNTAHTLNPVPLFLISNDYRGVLRPGKLGDVAPTILHYMGIPVPEEMKGDILID